MSKPPVDAVLAQLDKLSNEDLQLVIQTADNIRQGLEPEKIPPPEVVISLANELAEISDLTINIPIQLHFQLHADLRYQGPSRYGNWLDRLEVLEVSIKETGKSTIPVDMLIETRDGQAEGLLETILDSIGRDSWHALDVALGVQAERARIQKVCPSLTSYIARVNAFEEKLEDAGADLDMSAEEMYDTIDEGRLPKKGRYSGKKKAGKKKV